MTNKIKGDLVLTKDMTFDENIEVEGNIICKEIKYNLKVARNIVARNIDARDIVAGNIVARNIDARDIVAGNIDARNIIFCESVNIKDINKGKIKSRAVIRKRSKLELKEWDSD